MIQVKLSSAAAFLESLNSLNKDLGKKIIPQAQRAALRPILNAARKKLPQTGDSSFYTSDYDVETNSGKLRESLGIRSWRTTRRGLFIAVVGPRKGFTWVDKYGVKQDPRRYAVPLEFGHTLKFFGNSTGKFIPPRSFMRSSISEQRANVERIFLTKLQTAFLKYARKTGGLV